MLRVRKMTPEDFSFAVELSNTMNWYMSKEDFEFSTQLEPNGCFILLSEQERIGLATCISYGKVGWFGNLIVEKAFRKQGAGALLVNHAVSYLRSVGVSSIGLYAYPHLSDFYFGLGFKQDREFVVLSTDRVVSSSMPNQKTKVKPLEQKEITDLLKFDNQGFNANRSKTLKPILKDTKNLAYIEYDNTQISGYIACKIYGEVAEIGPLVCKPNYLKTTVNLLKVLFAEIKGKEAYLYLPTAKTELLNVAFEVGFKEKFSLVRMFLGPSISQDWVCAAESLERG